MNIAIKKYLWKVNMGINSAMENKNDSQNLRKNKKFFG